MTIWDWLSAIFVALGFVAWAIVGKNFQLHPALLGMMNTSIMALTVTLLSLRKFGDVGGKSFLSFRSFAVMFFLCVLNGIAFYVYSAKIANPLVKTGNYIVVVSIFMLAEARFLDWYFNSSSMGAINIVGLAMIIVGIV